MPTLEEIIAELDGAIRNADRAVHDVRMSVETAEDILTHLRLHAVGEELRRRKRGEKAEPPGWKSPFEDRADKYERGRQEYEERRRAERERERRAQEEFANRARAEREQRQRDQEEVLRRFQEAMRGARGFRFEDFAGFSFGFGGGRQRAEDESFDWGQHARRPPPKQPAGRPWHVVLGCEETATKPQIIKAYRRLAMKHHPDRGGKKEAFQEVQAAYEEVKKRWQK
jgi:hypothetical protein